MDNDADPARVETTTDGHQWLEPVGFLDSHRLVSNVASNDQSAGIRIDDFGAGADPAPDTPPWDGEGMTAAVVVDARTGEVTTPVVRVDQEEYLYGLGLQPW